MAILIIAVAIMAAWVLQTSLGTFQIRNFNKHYTAFKRNGKVSIGRSKGIFRTGVVLLMSVGHGRRVNAAKKMQGVTIFARFKDYDLLEGQDLLHVEPSVYNQMDRFTRKALDEAVEVYKRVAKGEEIPPAKSPFKKLLSNFSKS